MNARLGDFGLARTHHHGQLASTTRVIGTAGYIAPEVVKTGRASTQTDIFSFGVLILEVVSGRRPIEEGKPNLVDWIWTLIKRGDSISVLDKKLNSKGGYTDEEVDRVLHLGLLCVHPDANSRPTIRQVVKVLEGKTEGTGDEDEGMNVHLLKRFETSSSWNFAGSRGHPTFDKIHKNASSSPPPTDSDILLEGR